MAPLRRDRRTRRGRRPASPTRCSAEADAIVFEANDDHGRIADAAAVALPRRAGSAARRPDARRRRARWRRPVRDGARARSRPRPTPARRCTCTSLERPPVPRRGARRRPGNSRRRGSPHTIVPDAAAGWLLAVGTGRRRARRRRSDRQERRRRERRRHVPASRPSPRATASRSSSARRSRPSTPSRGRTRALPGDERRGRGARVPSAQRVAPRDTPASTRSSTSRRRAWSRPSPPRKASSSAVRDRRSRPPVGATPRRLPRSLGRRNRRAGRPGDRRRRADAAPPDGRSRDQPAARTRRSSRARSRTARRCATSSSATGCSPRTPSATSRTANWPRPAGAPRGSAIELVAVVLEYAGLSPQPLFVLGENDGHRARPARPDPAASRVRRRPARAAGAGRRATTASTRGRRWSACGSTRPTSGRYPARGRAAAARRDRRAQPALPARLRLVAAGVAITDGVYYGVRVGGRLVAAAGTHVISPTARLAVVGNVLTHAHYRGRGLRDGRRPAPSRQNCCASATRSCSTSGPTIHRRSRPTGGSATRSTSASKSG